MNQDQLQPGIGIGAGPQIQQDIPYAGYGVQFPTANLQSRVRVVHGANERFLDNASGRTIGSIRKAMREILSLSGGEQAFIDNKQVGDDFILADGQLLQFLKASGVKG